MKCMSINGIIYTNWAGDYCLKVLIFKKWFNNLFLIFMQQVINKREWDHDVSAVELHNGNL